MNFNLLKSKRISLKIFAFLLTLSVLILPLISKGDIPAPKECCKLRTTVDLGNRQVCYSRESVGPTDSQASECGSLLCGVGVAPNIWAMFCLIDSVQYITNWIFYILTLIVVIMVIWGAATILTAAGNPDGMTKGKQILTFALIGFVLALIAKFLPSIVKFFVIR